MKIYVCVKHVPDTAANIKVVGDAGFDESVKFIMNPYDEYAVEEAVRLAGENGGEVVVVSVGKAASVNTIRAALAVGADRGVLVKTDASSLDGGAAAMALKAAITRDGAPDLVFTGKQSVDSEGMQTHYRLAAALDAPAVNEVVDFRLENGRAVVECEAGGGDREVLSLELPCVIGATRGLNEPRYPKLPDILKARKKPLEEIDIDALGVETPAWATEVTALTAAPERGAARMMEGSVAEMVEELVDRLHTEAGVL